MQVDFRFALGDQVCGRGAPQWHGVVDGLRIINEAKHDHDGSTVTTRKQAWVALEGPAADPHRREVDIMPHTWLDEDDLELRVTGG